MVENSEEQTDTSEASAVETNAVEAGASAKPQDVNYVSSDTTDLKVGDDIGLTNKDRSLRKVLIGAGWDIRSFEGEAPDVDLSIFLLNKDDKTRKDPDFVFYSNLKSEEEEVIHKGDSREGAGEGDDEQIEADLQALPFEVASLLLVLSIHDGDIKEHDFSSVKNVFVRIVNLETGIELCKLELSDEFLESQPGACAMKLAKIFRDGPKWRFHACAEIPKKGSLRSIAQETDIIVV